MTAIFRSTPRTAVLLCLSLLPLLSCRREIAAEKIALQPTPVLTIRSTWGAVKSPLLRIREEPNNKATVMSHIRMGTVVEIISKSDAEDEVEGEVAYWYRINYDGLKGWVFGTYLEIFDSRAKADAFAETVK